MLISVIICTYNRAQILNDTLKSFKDVLWDKSFEYEILVVDNNSTDKTADIVDAWKKEYGKRLRYIFEANQGLSHARNRGIEEAKGDLIAFVDDDVSFDPQWMMNIKKIFDEFSGLGVGGRIVPKWPNDQTPWWYDASTRYAYAGVTGDLDLGDQRREFKLGHSAPFGGNMIWRKETFTKYGKFDVDLGRKGNDLGLNEDTEFSKRLMSAGEILMYAPDILIYHHVFSNRTKADYLRRWYFSLGKQKVLLEKDVVINSYIAGVPRYLYKTLIERLLKSFGYLAVFNLKKAFLWELRTRIVLGQMHQYRLLNRTTGSLKLIS